MAKRKKSSPKEATPDFETALHHLKEALGALESEELTLEQSLKQYENGIRYLGHCHRALESAKQKIEQLVTIDDQGKIVTKPFDGTASDQITSTTRRSRSAKLASSKPVTKKMAEDDDEDDLEDEDELRIQLHDEADMDEADIDDSDGLF